jgi:D-glycero-D-manno-heptose 1,7-bisphosphate phosphatase
LGVDFSGALEMTRYAIFVDRDGTLTGQYGGGGVEQTSPLLPGAGAAIRRINREAWQAVVVTNQPGVARGTFTEDAVADVHERLRLELLEEGARLDGIYYCPHHPDGVVERYRSDCACRKPGMALFERARDEMGIDLHGSFMIGDRITDLQAAAACGMPALLVRSGRGRESEGLLAGLDVAPMGVADTLEDAVGWVFDRRAAAEVSAP